VVVFRYQFFRPFVNAEVAVGKGKKPLVLRWNFYLAPGYGKIDFQGL